eukprot:Nitzschia sp. Nitz4//scaffold149_size55946//19883//21659//NITZ4_006593-RA/size55946-augustus-gene-0.65-mRNA-1//1//CDS//3329536806//9033//frame0
MRLDPTVMRTMNGQDFRVLEAVERGMQRHSLVPAPLISSLAQLRHGGTGKILNHLLRDKLISHDKSCGYDGYRLTNAGYDILALHHLQSRKLVMALGDRIGTGKESDIYLAVDADGQQVVLKFHRLGRTSFRNVKKTRDYFMYSSNSKSHRGGGSGASQKAHSWLFLSRQSALKEYAFMKALYDVKYPTPTPIAHNRHIVVMSLVRGVPLYQVRPQHLTTEQAASIFEQAAHLAVQLARHGLVHCDLNEFNLLVDLSGIQQSGMSQEHDPYVRHSGMSVVAESTPGMLSARGPWEPEYLHPDNVEEHSQNSQEEPPKPLELLENGQAKPIVTLIDFPQMVSTQHPNAKELYERDTTCLFKFFSHKLQFQIPEAEQESLCLTWEALQRAMQDAEALAELSVLPESGDGEEANDTASVCLASKAQLRLDQELKASGYSEEDANRDLELYYYQTVHSTEQDGELEEGDEEEDDGKQGANDNDDDDGSIESNPDDKIQEASVVSASPSQYILSPDQLVGMSREQLQEQARLRVQQQLESQKKKSRQKGAFRKRNSNKTFVKGKRVFQDVGLQ